jgi:archaellum component FlaG (FlaF/FlaG flagellin family)
MFRLLRIHWPHFFVGAFVGLIMLSSCGYNDPQHATSSSPQFASGHNPDTATNTPQLTSAPGPVTITINALTYRTNDTITVTLNNRGSQAIFFVDQHTNCTVLLMQRQVDGKWQNIENCYVARRSIWSTLNPGQQLQVKLNPPRGNWLPGRYRVNLDFSIGQTSYSFTTLSSVDFQVENS